MNRKQRRAQAKLSKKETTKDLSEKMFQFEQLPDECLACLKPFDKKSKEMAMTWNVVVKENPSVVRLYCPDCWQLANDAIRTLKEEIQNGR